MQALGVTVHGGRVLPVKFTVTNPARAFVNDPSCTIKVADQAGNAQVVAPCRVDGATTSYHTDVDISRLPAGSYRVIVGFDSPALTGSFSMPLQVS